MSQTFLLPCSCGQEIPVETSQAGQRLTCSCGNVLDVPSMREIRQLKPAAVETGKKRRSRTGPGWHPLQGALFGLGALVLLASLFWIGYVQLYRNSLDTREQKWDNLDDALATIDDMTIEEIYMNWKAVQMHGLGDRTPPAFIVAREEDQRMWVVQRNMMIVSAVGLLLIIASLVLTPRRLQRR